MPRNKSRLEKSLLDKGFIKTEGDHNYFIYYTQDGLKTAVKTKTSHTKKMKDIPDNLLSQMAKQCRLNKAEFLNLVDCPLSQDNNII
jgi:predicted transcriptional regulator